MLGLIQVMEPRVAKGKTDEAPSMPLLRGVNLLLLRNGLSVIFELLRVLKKAMVLPVRCAGVCLTGCT